jgi:hypothetical protein
MAGANADQAATRSFCCSGLRVVTSMVPARAVDDIGLRGLVDQRLVQHEDDISDRLVERLLESWSAKYQSPPETVWPLIRISDMSETITCLLSSITAGNICRLTLRRLWEQHQFSLS